MADFVIGKTHPAQALDRYLKIIKIDKYIGHMRDQLLRFLLDMDHMAVVSKTFSQPGLTCAFKISILADERKLEETFDGTL